MPNRHWCQKGGKLANPGKDHTYQCEECVHPLYVQWGRLAHCGVVMKGYLKWRAAVSCRTSSQMWGSWYFTRFLLRDGSLTQINMASLMVLVTQCASLP